MLEPPLFPGASVLIVEDDGFVAAHLTEELIRLGYRVAGVAASGEDALAQFAKLNPDVVLMDITLRGEMDGIEAAKRIGQISDVPVLFLTAHADPGTIENASAAKPNGYLVKPVNSRQLQANLVLALDRPKRRKAASSPAPDAT